MSNSIDTARTAPHVSPAERSFPPRTLGAWKIDALLAEGAFTRVYRARPADSGRDRPADYVLKVLRKQFEQDRLAVDMMRRECYLGRRISHPHLGSVLDAAVREAPYFVVLPNLPGVSLERMLSENDWLPIPHTLWIGRQVAEALAAMHRLGWVHSDVKPANILIAPNGHATLIDLGLARRIDEPAHVVDRPLNGTLQYLAPELVSSTFRAGPPSDVYSLGVTLYQAFTGRLPLSADSMDGLVRAHREMVPPSPRRLRPQLPRAVSQLILQMLSKYPLRRPQSATDLADRLTGLEIETFEERFAA
jgi:serine/threonine-protein kinase